MNSISDSDSAAPSRVWIGIDISKDKFDACLLRGSGGGVRFDAPNTADGHAALVKWARSNASLAHRHFCMEATGRYGNDLARFLHEAGEPVSVVNPTVVKYSGPNGSSNKTDKADARKIARFARSENPALWEPEPEKRAIVTELVRHIDMLTRQKAEYATRLAHPGHSAAVRASLESIMDAIAGQIDDIQRKLDDHIGNDPELDAQQSLIDSVPGIAKSTAQLLMAEMPRIGRLVSAQAAAAFFGLSPRRNESGKSRKSSSVSKCGRSLVRAGLYFPAVTAMRCNDPVKELAKRMAANGRCKMQIIVAAMRKLVMQVYGVLKNQTPFDKDWSRNHQLSKA